MLRSWSWLALGGLLCLGGCSSGLSSGARWSNPEINLAWPQAPSPPRIRFLRTVNEENIGEGDGSKGNRFFEWLAGKDRTPRPLANAYGVVADGEGRIWVTDSGTPAIHRFDLTRGTHEQWLSAANRPLTSPVGIAVDSGQGRIFVADSIARSVSIFDYSGKWQGFVQPNKPFSRPGGLAVDSAGQLYVVDVLEGTVEVFDRNLAYQKTIRGSGQGGGFNHPTAVVVAKDGRIFVVDSLNFRVEVQDSQGNFLGYIGQLGDGPGTFARPRGIALDSTGNIYVTDAAFDNIQVFDSEGNLLLYFGQPGRGAGQFCLPAGLFMDNHDRLYAVDACNFRVQIFQYLVSP